MTATPQLARVARHLASRAPQSAALTRAARRVAPGGASHDARQLNPHGIFVRAAQGARKTDVDGNAIVDLVCGHGALLFGHGHAPAVDAAQRALASGVHFGAGTAAELAWAQAVQRRIPCAERVRFTASGNEACLLAAAVARLATGRNAILSIKGHYLGWALPAVLPRIDIADAPDADTRLCIADAADADAAVDALATGRFAAIMLEPTGASFGKAPLSFTQLRAIAHAARERGTLTLFDETITGFRVSPGGAQYASGVTPDLAVLGKILGGGLPCGALAGRAHLMDLLDNTPESGASGPHLSHMGTGNGNPVVAAAGVATLHALGDGAPCAEAEAAAAELRARLNALFDAKRVPWAAYGAHSGLHLFLNPFGRALDPAAFDAAAVPATELLLRERSLINALRVALLGFGADINPWPGGLLSTAHGIDDIVLLLDAFASAIDAMADAPFTLAGWGSV